MLMKFKPTRRGLQHQCQPLAAHTAPPPSAAGHIIPASGAARSPSAAQVVVPAS
jgi:hypothetical protein